MLALGAKLGTPADQVLPQAWTRCVVIEHSPAAVRKGLRLDVKLKDDVHLTKEDVMRKSGYDGIIVLNPLYACSVVRPGPGEGRMLVQDSDLLHRVLRDQIVNGLGMAKDRVVVRIRKGEDTEVARQKLQTLGLKAPGKQWWTVTVPGKVTRREMAALIRKSWAALHPSGEARCPPPCGGGRRGPDHGG